MSKSEKKKSSIGKKILILLIILILLAAAACGAMIYYTKSAQKDYDGKIMPNTKIADIEAGGMTRQEAEKAVNDKLDGSKLLMKAENKELRIPISDIDADFDVEKTVAKAYGIGRDGNFYENFKDVYNAKRKDGAKVKISVDMSDDAALKLVKNNSAKFNCKKQNAKIVPKNGNAEIIDGQVGLKVNNEESAKIVKKALTSWKGDEAVAELSAEIQEPKYKAEDLKGMTDILGKYSTEYDKGYYGRAKNLEVGSSKICDTILEPGETLSVYELTSPYTPENGYYKAGTYVGDETVEDYGGGMCQVSTTLYNAAIRAELEIVERESHGRTVHYVPLSADAAISGTEKDLKFKNNLEDPIYIYGKAEGGDIAFYIFGKETRDPSRTIAFETKVLSVTPPTEKVKKDKELEKGKRKVDEPGQTGYTAELWKIVYKDGKEVERTKFNSSSYRMVPTKILEGTKKPDKDKDKDKKKNSKSKKNSSSSQ